MKNSLFSASVSTLQKVSSRETATAKLSAMILPDTTIKYKKLVERVRQEADPAKRKELKAQLPCFTPSGVFGGKVCAANLVRHSGFLGIDIDEKDNADNKKFGQLKEDIKAVKCVAYCGQSVGGKGWFCLVPIADPAKHSEYFRQIAADFLACGIRIDRACSDVSRKRFVSYDPEPYINTAAELYDRVPATATPATATPAAAEEVRTRARQLLDKVQASRADITGGYQQWFEILCAVASIFGTEGEDYAQAVSSYSPTYDPGTTARQYRKCVAGCYGYTAGTLFHYASKEMGIHDFDDMI